MNLKELQALCGEITCEPFEFAVGCFTCHGPSCDNGTHVLWLRASLFRRDTDTGEEDWGFGGYYPVMPHEPEQTIVKRFFVAARDYAEHEVRESFHWTGFAVLSPHIDLEKLIEAL